MNEVGPHIGPSGLPAGWNQFGTCEPGIPGGRILHQVFDMAGLHGGHDSPRPVVTLPGPSDLAVMPKNGLSNYLQNLGTDQHNCPPNGGREAGRTSAHHLAMPWDGPSVSCRQASRRGHQTTLRSAGRSPQYPPRPGSRLLSPLHRPRLRTLR